MTQGAKRIGRMLLWGLLPGYAFLGLFSMASDLLPRLTVLGLGTFTLALALPMMLTLWHQATVRRLLSLHQFQPGRGLHRWGSRRALSTLWRAALAIVLSAAVLLQSVFFGPLEWLLLGLAPLLYLLVRQVFDAVPATQFTQAIYAQRWSLWATQWTVTLLLALAWIAARKVLAEVPVVSYAERIYELQSAWASTPSGTVKWALDAGAWGQATVEALDQLAGETWWRLLLVLVIAPVSVFGHLSLSLSGLSLPVAEVRRTLGELTADRSPPPVGPARAAQWAAVASIVVLMLFQLLGELDHHLRTADSPLAIKPLPECERIDGKVYALNTAGALEALFGEARAKVEGHKATACAKLGEIEALAAKGVDDYLNWYFSLGAEWSRFAVLLTGDLDLLLQAKFSEMVMSSPEIVQRLPVVQATYEGQWAQVVGARSGAVDLLYQNRLVLDERDCEVIKETSLGPFTAQWEDSKARLVSGSGAGLIAGSLAAKATTKAMTKTTMKSASAVLAKAAVKKGIGKAGAVAIGATVGTMLAPGVGTAVGALIGAGVGLVMGVGIDMVALAAEEKLTREDMRRDLLSAVRESLQSHRDTFDCKSVGRVAGPGTK